MQKGYHGVITFYKYVILLVPGGFRVPDLTG